MTEPAGTIPNRLRANLSVGVMLSSSSILPGDLPPRLVAWDHSYLPVLTGIHCIVLDTPTYTIGYALLRPHRSEKSHVTLTSIIAATYLATS